MLLLQLLSYSNESCSNFRFFCQWNYIKDLSNKNGYQGLFYLPRDNPDSKDAIQIYLLQVDLARMQIELANVKIDFGKSESKIGKFENRFDKSES